MYGNNINTITIIRTDKNQHILVLKLHKSFSRSHAFQNCLKKNNKAKRMSHIDKQIVITEKIKTNVQLSVIGMNVDLEYAFTAIAMHPSNSKPNGIVPSPSINEYKKNKNILKYVKNNINNIIYIYI